MSEEVNSSEGTEGSGEVVPVARERKNLEHPWVRARLVRELAIAEKAQYLLAEEYGVGPSAITMFKQRHQTEIELQRENLADKFSDIWAADKRNRIATLAKSAERLADNKDARSAEVLAKLLKDIAEELGDIPTKPGVQINQANVTYSIEGVDLKDLT